MHKEVNLYTECFSDCVLLNKLVTGGLVPAV